MAALLVSAMAGLVGLALATVMAIQFSAGREAATGLFQSKAELLVELVASRVREELDPAASQVAFIAGLLARPDADDSRTRVIDLLTGAVGGTDNIQRLAFLSAAERVAIVVDRAGSGAEVWIRDLADEPTALAGLEAGRQLIDARWGEFLFTPRFTGPAVNRRQSVWREGRYIGLVTAFVSLPRLSSAIEDSAVGDYAGTPFVLYGENEVLAHPRLRTAFAGLTPEHPLPSLAELGDPVLARIWAERANSPLLRAIGTGHIVRIDGTNYIFLHKTLTQYGAVPWTVGAYFRAQDVADNLRTLVFATAAGLGVLVLSLIAAVLVARRIAKPTQRFAEAAGQLATLDFDHAQSLPRSRIRELDDQALAFNRLLAALRWFEAYVPRKLVRQLAQAGLQGELPSQTRDVTVLFSDIVGFTTRAQNMSPADTAALLNRHFAVAIDAIEATGGTVDKFMGDGIMAFWGAPEPLENHARAALAAARAIAASAVGCDVRLRLGLHSGPVVAGNVGSAKRLNYTILGDTVNAAQRIESLGHSLMLKDAQTCVLASATTIEAAGGAADFDQAGEFMLRGRHASVSIFRLRADGAVPPAL
jgi:adenylate cyclase